MAGFDILIAEDDSVLRNLYTKKFAREGYVLRLAGDGEEVIRMIEEKQPDVLVLDVRMPKKDGLQVLRELPKRKRTFPIIVLTNFYDDAIRDQSKELGADHYCSKKDTTMKRLLETVEAVLKPAETK